MINTEHTIWIATIVLSILSHAALFLGYGNLGSKQGIATLVTVNHTRISFKTHSSIDKKTNDIEKHKSKTRSSQTRPTPKNKQDRQKTKNQAEQEKKHEQLVKSSSATQSNSGAVALQRKQYLNTLMAHIEKHKFYPQTARRRSITGHADITLSITLRGSIDQIDCQSRQAYFCEAAKQAVYDSQPFPQAPANTFPLILSYKMDFSLK